MTSAVRHKAFCDGTALAIALIAPALLSAPTAFAQTAEHAPDTVSQTRHAENKAHVIDQQVRAMTKALNLDAAQQSAVKAILQERQLQSLQLRLDPTVLPEARTDKFRALQDHTVERIRAVLTDEQKLKYDPTLSRKIAPADNTSVEDWIKATTPP